MNHEVVPDPARDRPDRVFAQRRVCRIPAENLVVKSCRVEQQLCRSHRRPTRVVVEVHQGAVIPGAAYIWWQIHEVGGEQYRMRPPLFPTLNAICELCECDIVTFVGATPGDVAIPWFRVQA